MEAVHHNNFNVQNNRNERKSAFTSIDFEKTTLTISSGDLIISHLTILRDGFIHSRPALKQEPIAIKMAPDERATEWDRYRNIMGSLSRPMGYKTFIYKLKSVGNKKRIGAVVNFTIHFSHNYENGPRENFFYFLHCSDIYGDSSYVSCAHS